MSDPTKIDGDFMTDEICLLQKCGDCNDIFYRNQGSTVCIMGQFTCAACMERRIDKGRIGYG